MEDIVRIALIGDYREDMIAHQVIPQALERAARPLSLRLEIRWLATSQVQHMRWEDLAKFDGLWCVPGTAYTQSEGVLRVIRLARERWLPFLGTCLGFHYTLIEYARHVLSLPEADHAAIKPDAGLPLIAPLVRSHTDERILFQPGSSISRIYGVYETIEQYGSYDFGLDPRCRDLLTYDDLAICGLDRSGAVQAVELHGHPFFFATQYQPELHEVRNEMHPLIKAFLRAAA
jgi:CTP synthase (UTP-ammonia lyase)